jgi:RimJ/RimL family protein N-acetyltransferase
MLVLEAPVRTARLILRPFRWDDLALFNAFDRLPDVARYLYSTPRDLDASRVALERKIAATAIRAAGEHMSLAVELASGGGCIGDVLLEWTGNEHLQGEIGYVFHPDHHGRGYATEACEELLRMGFETLGLHRIAARCDARNDASARVMARLGMRREAHLVENEMVKGEWTDELVYALLDREWQMRRGNALA